MANPYQQPDSPLYKRKKPTRQPLLGNHQKCWIWGRNTVLEMLKAKRWNCWELLLSDQLSFDDYEEALAIAEQLSIHVKTVSQTALAGQVRADDHQGYAAKMAPFPYATEEEFRNSLSETATIAVLDRIQDPNNLGAIIRAAEVLNVACLVIGESEQVGVTSAVARASSGAVNFLPIFRVPDLVKFVQETKQHHSVVVGMALGAETFIYDVPFHNKPHTILIGNEAAGICDKLLALCDHRASIPMTGKIDSLNAAVAAGVVFSEIYRQKNGKTK